MTTNFGFRNYDEDDDEDDDEDEDDEEDERWRQSGLLFVLHHH